MPEDRVAHFAGNVGLRLVKRASDQEREKAIADARRRQEARVKADA